MKKCFKCGNEKPLTDFYRHSKMADGHLNKCKDCAKRDMHESRHVKHRERVLAYDRERGKQPHRLEMQRRITAEWTQKHPRERKAQLALGNAVRSGAVKPWPVCAMPQCDQKPEAHHPDYDAALNVVWLCRAHHMQAHAVKANHG